MSNPPVQPENAASAALVNPDAYAMKPAGQDVTVPPGSNPARLPEASPTRHEPGSLPHADASLSPVHTSTAPGSTASTIDDASAQNKWSRGPVPQLRSSGPSLLTQALATSRTIPESQDENPVRLTDRTDTGHTPQSPQEAADYSDGDTLTPRGSPRVAVVTPTAASSATGTPRQRATEETSDTPRQSMLDTRDIGSTWRSHQEFLDRSIGGGKSLERPDKLAMKKQEPLARPQHFSTVSEETIRPTRPYDGAEQSAGNRTASQDMASTGSTATREQEPQSRRKLDHRVTMGSEKAWSIGTGESSNSQDGQVEKSITEVLAGLEPNTRSRKASHSLRFFKEGLPEEKIKRRETSRPSDQRRETYSGERLGDLAVEGTPSTSGHASPQTHEARNHLHRAKTFAQSPKAPPIPESPEDYFELRTDNRGTSVASPFELQVRTKPSEKTAPATESKQDEPTAGGESEEHADHDARRQSGDSTETGENADGDDDGDDSSEEKISSAVFVPHQGPEEPPRVSSPGPPRLGPGSRTLSRSEDFHPWLVKADEPEPEDEDHLEVQHHHEGSVLSDFEATSSVPNKEVISHLTEEPALVEESETIPYRVQPSRTNSQYYEELVHEHQVKPKEPLDAIELKPYKHQVGGHTTVWRFSKRAVCKQLNNSENKFYEIVERDHPELLAFLPRFVHHGESLPGILQANDAILGTLVCST